ncbi:LexA family protein [Acidaminococcus provencensis]|uniref:LexA family protein n=1 Tax=Acidaminococcus provencensis TaxID=2058289 RepID=UPI0022E494A3|nr:S24 family peptidase [Acidaminococcus provencensis]
MSTAERLKKALEIRDMTQAELSRLTGIGTSGIAQYYHGKVVPKQDKVYLMAKALNVNPAWLMGLDVPMQAGLTSVNFKRVPMLGYAAAGAPLEDINQDTPYYDIDNRYKVDFCITISGDSMVNAGINDGDIVFIKQQPEVEVGQIGCFEIEGERVCLKRFYETDTGVMLVSENPKYAPMVFNVDNCQDFRCLGLAVLKQSVIK